jgi:ATP-binding cassette subfamily F protein 3
MIKITDLNKSFGSRELFDNLNFSVGYKERVGLVGRNGHGKTTLFKMILGQMEYDSGLIGIPKGYKIGYLEQHINFTRPTVLEEASLALPKDETDATWKAEKILFGLGFSKLDMSRNPLEFSGGYKIRINLAKVLLSDADMLLLDEPNNYLDIVTIRWLETFLRQWKGELMLITHDRSFMDNVVTHCVALHRNKARKVEGSTQKLYEQIAKEEEIYEKTRQNIEKKRKATELFIRRFRAKARLAGMVQSRIKSLAKQKDLQALDEIENLDFDFSNLEFPAAKMMGIHNLTFGYDKENILINDLNIDIGKGEKICVIGKNGKGKSTLLKIIAGRLNPLDGNIKAHNDLKTSYFVQSDTADLNPLKTVFEEIASSDVAILPQKARNIAGAMMFSGDDALKKIGILSGGEKSRVLLGKILVKPCHLLLLDEPTNHLDLESCEALIDAVNNFKGSVILVTHNEELLHNIAQRLIIFDRGKVSVFEGTYKEFLETSGWEDEGASQAGVKVKPASKYAKEEVKKIRARLVQEKSKTLKPLEEKINFLEAEIIKKEEAVEANNQKIVEASLNADVSFIVEGPKLNKLLKTEIEAMYTELAITTELYEEKKEYFQKQMENLD